MSETIIITKDNDMLDALCKAHYGRESPVPDVLEANPILRSCRRFCRQAFGSSCPTSTWPLPSAPEVRLWG